ncbi:hypothetical protein N431DRAFT_544250 [Stipitochalara longipes BDJ]|nr:hypothetical protein N431DRAFT_544250 [Stipitochalara longipes BDJ]
MSNDIPKAFFSAGHSAFALIDPRTESYHRVLDRHGAFRSGLKMHVAISYVWSEWKNDPSERLPSWTHLRERLLAVVGPQTPPDLRKETWNASCCWLDSKCINQDSEADRLYWIPKMDEVYHEAECTILLLRDCDLTVLMEIAREMKCKYEGKVPLAERMLAGPHSCLLTRSCTTLPEMGQEREDECLRALKSFASATWRRRAWIFQEILLSRSYLVNWSQTGWTSLANIGVIAGIMFQKESKETWLEEFASWCSRVEYLHQYYETTSFSDLELEATVPCDRYYALCGILRLKRIQYNPTHAADRALHTIIEALTKAGRLSWLYAVPPRIEDPNIELSGNSMAPFVLTRMDGGKLFAKTRNISLNSRALGLDAAQIGTVTRVEPLRQVLLDIKTLLKDTEFNLDNILNNSSPGKAEVLKHVPALVYKAAVEIVAPLLLEPVFGDVCKTLSIDEGRQSLKQWIMILLLLSTTDVDCTAVSLVRSSAILIRNQLKKIQDRFALVQWEGVGGDKKLCRFALGFPEVQRGSKVYMLEADKNLFLAAVQNASEENGEFAAFRGMLFPLEMGDMIGLIPSSLFGPFWKSLRRGGDARLAFLLRDFDLGGR